MVCRACPGLSGGFTLCQAQAAASSMLRDLVVLAALPSSIPAGSQCPETASGCSSLCFLSHGGSLPRHVCPWPLPWSPGQSSCVNPSLLPGTPTLVSEFPLSQPILTSQSRPDAQALPQHTHGSFLRNMRASPLCQHTQATWGYWRRGTTPKSFLSHCWTDPR